MWNKNLLGFLFIILVLLNIPVHLFGQNDSLSKISFLNAPVLFKEGGKSFQQVAGSYKSEVPGEIVVTGNNRELLKAALKKGGKPFPAYFSCRNQASKSQSFRKDQWRSGRKLSDQAGASQNLADQFCTALPYRYRLYPSAV
ncbi:MAG: hypothetical protein AB2L20_26510 [Mangrovibacterium sp.]